MEVRPLEAGERQWMTETLTKAWGGPVVVRRGEVSEVAHLDGLVAHGSDGEPVGLLTYALDHNSLEVVTLDAFVPGRGAGTALLAGAVELARQAGLWRLWLVTTSDNVDAMAFYLRRGLRMAAVYQNGAAWSRQLKPSIPTHGAGGVPIEDEVEFELVLGGKGPPPRSYP